MILRLKILLENNYRYILVKDTLKGKEGEKNDTPVKKGNSSQGHMGDLPT